MSEIPPTSPLDSEPILSRVKELIAAGETNTSIVQALLKEHGLATSIDSLRRFRRRHNSQIPGVGPAYTKIKNDFAEAQQPPAQFVRKVDEPPVLDNPDDMLRERGLDPLEWYIDDDRGVTVNQWDGPHVDGNVVTYYQAKFTAKKKKPEVALQPVRSDGWTRPTKWWKSRPSAKPELVVIVGDHQAPFYDRQLHALFLDFLADVEPRRGVHLGDLLDFPNLSIKHKPDPDNLAEAQECMQVGYDIFRGCVDASPETEWDLLLGNHDIRLYDYEASKAPNSQGLRLVNTPDGPGDVAHSLRHLMRLDELGVNLVEPHGSYEDAQVNLSKNLAVRHGWIARKDGGKSALETLKMTGFSILVGHTHRQSLVQHTTHEIDGTPRQLLAAEIGCMCRLDRRGQLDEQGRRYPNYTTLPDWQQGFATATIYPDGKFKVDLASYVNGVLLWRDKRYE